MKHLKKALVFHAQKRVTDYHFGFVFYFPGTETGRRDWMLGRGGFMGPISQLLMAEVSRSRNALTNMAQLDRGQLHRSQVHQQPKFYLLKVSVSAAELGPKEFKDVLTRESKSSLKKPDSSFLKRRENLRNNFQKKASKKNQIEHVNVNELTACDLDSLVERLGPGLDDLFGAPYLGLAPSDTFGELNEDSLSQIDPEQEILRVYSNQNSFVANARVGENIRSWDRMVVLKLLFVSREVLHANRQDSVDAFLSSLTWNAGDEHVFERQIKLFEISEKLNTRKPLFFGNQILERVQTICRGRGLRPFVDRVAAFRRGEIKDPGYGDTVLQHQLQPLFEDKFHVTFLVGVRGDPRGPEVLNTLAFASRLKQLRQKVKVMSLLEMERRDDLNMFDSMIADCDEAEPPLEATRQVEHESIWVNNLFQATGQTDQNSLELVEPRNDGLTRDLEICVPEHISEREIRKPESRPDMTQDKENSPMKGVFSPRFSVFFNRKREEIREVVRRSSVKHSRHRSQSAWRSTRDLECLGLLKSKIEELVKENGNLRGQISRMKAESVEWSVTREKINESQYQQDDELGDLERRLNDCLQKVLAQASELCPSSTQNTHFSKTCDELKECVRRSIDAVSFLKKTEHNRKNVFLKTKYDAFEIQQNLLFIKPIFKVEMLKSKKKTKQIFVNNKIKHIISKFSQENLKNILNNNEKFQNNFKKKDKMSQKRQIFDEDWEQFAEEEISKAPKLDMRTSIFRDEFIVRKNREYDMIWDSLVDLAPSHFPLHAFDSRTELMQQNLTIQDSEPYIFRNKFASRKAPFERILESPQVESTKSESQKKSQQKRMFCEYLRMVQVKVHSNVDENILKIRILSKGRDLKIDSIIEEPGASSKAGNGESFMFNNNFRLESIHSKFSNEFDKIFGKASSEALKIECWDLLVEKIVSSLIQHILRVSNDGPKPIKVGF